MLLGNFTVGEYSGKNAWYDYVSKSTGQLRDDMKG